MEATAAENPIDKPALGLDTPVTDQLGRDNG